MASLLIHSVKNNSYRPLNTSQNTSTTVACEFQDGVIIGADSRRTSRDYVTNRMVNKLIKIDDRIYCYGSGPTANVQCLIDDAMYRLSALKLNGDGLSIATTAAVFREQCYNNRNNAHVEFLIVGCDDFVEKGRVYLVSSGGMLNQESVCAIGSGSAYVLGYVDACYTKIMDKEEAQAFVVKTLQLAMSRDNFSGGDIHLVVIANIGVEVKQVINEYN